MAAHVLIVDDDDGIRLALRMVLEDTSYKVDEAPDGVAALRLITSSADGMVILLDNLMPGLDAGELLVTLEEVQRDGHDVGQANGACHTIRHAFILMTASPQRITPVLATRLARLDAPVVAKPFDLSAVWSSSRARSLASISQKQSTSGVSTRAVRRAEMARKPTDRTGDAHPNQRDERAAATGRFRHTPPASAAVN
jgi:CheY-like chemotaxis protein